ncbi:MAG: SPOR domain-containing protein [Gemmatimonadaceae bacterium]
MWESAGRRMAGAVDHACAVAVLGDDPVATAAAAVGVARAQAMHRRVVVIDLLGEHSDLAKIVGDPDAPGITDILEYGVSLRRAAVPVREQPNLFVVPAGIEPPLNPYFLQHPRWRNFAHDFRDAGALMVVVAPALVPGTEKLLDQLDGLVIVRGAAVPATNVPTLADIRLSAQYPQTMRRTPAIARSRIEVEETPKSRALLVALGIVMLLGLAAAVWYLKPWSSGVSPRRAESMAREAARNAAIRAPDLAAAGAPVGDWGIALASVNSTQGAMLRVAQVVDSLPSATYSPTLPTQGGAWWYRVVVGAFPDSAGADSVLVTLRQLGKVPSTTGRVIPTPLALMLADSVSEADAVRRVRELQLGNIPAYALLLRPGRARLYVGAFDSETAAAPLKATLDSLNFQTTLVKRVGSVF